MNMKEQDTCDLKKMTILSLNNSIMLRSIRASSLVKDVIPREIRRDRMTQILPTIIRMKDLNFSIKLSFNQFVKQLEG